jgi:ABC-type amino acid transport system permease subunit
MKKEGGDLYPCPLFLYPGGAPMQESTGQKATIPFWRDERILNILGQAAFIIGLLFIGSLIYQNMRAGLAKQGITLSYNFLQKYFRF